MKTSFYFVVWIAIYPLLGLLGSSFINENAFIVALLAVWGISWLINRTMPETLAYERATQIAPVLEDIFTGNLIHFRKRLTRQAIVEAVTSFYFLITTLVLVLSVARSGGDDWLALIIFALFTFSTISRSIKLLQAYSRLKTDLSKEECARVAMETYRLDYEAYAQNRERGSYADMLPPKPKHFRAFQIFSMIVSGICVALGLIYIVLGLGVMFAGEVIGTGAIAGMYFLYGSLAAYFGIKDLISSVSSKA
ncbi:MAG: hypothetical protein K2H38_05825 [Muribaculaceae bacterium]|nr:hypothetical protein [Muribaculaceae bacterium]MDE6554060.1 hypothetical protein [Muribaculaceae bacterium]